MNRSSSANNSNSSTVVIVPRERFSSIIASLESLFKTIDDDVPVIVVEGKSPFWIRQKLRKLQRKRPFDWIALDYLITPHEARNMGAKKAETEFVAFCDNDIEYESKWLEKLEANARKNNSAVVGPLIFIGPFEQPTIHHAGGTLYWQDKPDGARMLAERHRLMNAIYPDVRDEIEKHAPVVTEVCEFHCLLMRKSFFNEMGGLDERLVTRDQMDLALRAKAAGAKVTFEKDSHVSYLAKSSFTITDLMYHLFRWSDEFAIRSLTAFEETWGIELNKQRIRHQWIAGHRVRACLSLKNASLLKIVGEKRMKEYGVPMFEFIAKKLAASRSKLPPKPIVPRSPDRERALNSIPQENALPPR